MINIIILSVVYMIGSILLFTFDFMQIYGVICSIVIGTVGVIAAFVREQKSTNQ